MGRKTIPLPAFATEKPRRGRPRSSRAHRAILAAAATLLAEAGYEALSIEAVAARAGVGKQTIYRWWASKADLAMEALSDLAAREVPVPDTGSAEGDLTGLLSEAFRVLTSSATGRALAGLLVAAQADGAVAEAFRARFIEGRREAVRQVLRRGVARGELRADLDAEVVVDLLYGPMWYRLLIGHAPLDASFAGELVRTAFQGMFRRDPGAR